LINQKTPRFYNIPAKANPCIGFSFYLLSILLPFCLQAQLNKTIPQVYSTFDSIVGEQNMELYNGPLFKESLAGNSNTHPYFLQSDFINGDIIFDEQHYFDQNVKYHVHLDELLVTPKYKPTGIMVRLIKNKVKEFTIDGHRFIQLPSTIADSEQYGYLEVLETVGQNVLLKKYKKKRVQARKESRVVIQYEQGVDYFLLFNGELIEANTKSNWGNIFESQKKELRTFFKQNRMTYKTDKDTFLKLLFNKLANANAL
jgi:hypothetical protein